MKEYSNEIFECSIPKDWMIDEEECISIYENNGNGALTISILTNFQESAIFDDTMVSVASNFIKSNNISFSKSLIFNCINKNRLVLYGDSITSNGWNEKLWIIGKHPKIIVATYLYDKQDKKEIKKVEKIIESIKIKI